MNHPAAIAIASVVPGLGYLLLGKLRSAVYVWLALLTAALVLLFSPIELLWDVAVIAILGVWIAQIVWASRDAARERRIASGEVTAAKEAPSLAGASPPGLSRKEKQAYNIRQTVKSQIGMGENLGPVVMVMDRPQASLYTTQYYLGAVDSGLVLVELSMTSKTKSVERIARELITGVEFKKGLLTDRLRLHLKGQKKPSSYYAQRVFRKQMQEMASTIEAW